MMRNLELSIITAGKILRTVQKKEKIKNKNKSKKI